MWPSRSQWVWQRTAQDRLTYPVRTPGFASGSAYAVRMCPISTTEMAQTRQSWTMIALLREMGAAAP